MILTTVPQAVLDRASAAVVPLRRDAASSSANPSRGFLEELLKSGTAAVAILGQYARERGNTYFKMATNAPAGELKT